MRTVFRVLFAVVTLVMVPASLRAQGAITGVVKDASGAVLPGVTVEAASPVLIEKVRSVVSDDTGQYRIVDLRPGTYSVTFTLPGFSTVKREGIELSGTFVATINADLKVGALAETITVTGETPIVDVQSAKVQTHDEQGHHRGHSDFEERDRDHGRSFRGWPRPETTAALPEEQAGAPRACTAVVRPTRARCPTASTWGGPARTRTRPS